MAEAAHSSASCDLQDKKDAYNEGGVREYVVWRVEERGIDWLRLEDGQYTPLPMDQGVYKSEVFPGLWLDPAALINGDFARLQQVLQTGLASEEHQHFVALLAARRK